MKQNKHAQKIADVKSRMRQTVSEVQAEKRKTADYIQALHKEQKSAANERSKRRLLEDKNYELTQLLDKCVKEEQREKMEQERREKIKKDMQEK